MRTLLILALAVGCGNVKDNNSKDANDFDAPTDASEAPTILSMAPDWGSTAGGTRVQIKGTNLSVDGLVVKFGAATAQAAVISDTELMVTTPPGPHAKVMVSVTTSGGTVNVASQFRYLAPLYAGDGRGGNMGVLAANLYIINPATAVSTTVGPIGFSVSGLAISPDGILFGATVGGAGPSLITIDPYTGTGTLVGLLKTSANVAAGAADITFNGNTLVGWRGTTMTTIDRTSGLVTLSPTTLASGAGCGLASTGTALLVAPAKASGQLFTVNATTGAATVGPTMNGLAVSVSAMTTVGNQLLASINTTNTSSSLATINPANGNVQVIGALPAKVDGLAGIPAQP